MYYFTILFYIQRRCFFYGSFLLFLLHVCLYYTVLSVSCSLVITFWERAGLLAPLCVMFPCGFVTFQYGVSGLMWYLIVSIPDLRHFLYFFQYSLMGRKMTMLHGKFRDADQSAYPLIHISTPVLAHQIGISIVFLPM